VRRKEKNPENGKVLHVNFTELKLFAAFKELRKVSQKYFKSNSFETQLQSDNLNAFRILTKLPK
jgi:hypothetical protein